LFVVVVVTVVLIDDDDVDVVVRQSFKLRLDRQDDRVLIGVTVVKHVVDKGGTCEMGRRQRADLVVVRIQSQD